MFMYYLRVFKLLIIIVLFFCRCDEEIVIKTQAQKMLRELENQLVEVHEDLEAEKEARAKAEKQKRDLNEVKFLIFKFISLSLFLGMG